MLRMPRTALLLPLCFALALPCASAQPMMSSSKPLTIYNRPEPPASQPVPRVAALVRQLASPSLTTREVAERSLLALGPTILPQLRYAFTQEQAVAKQADAARPAQSQTFLRGFGQVHHPPSELQSRPASYILPILIERLDQTRLTTPTSITLHLADAPLADILREFAHQLNVDLSAVAISFSGHPPDNALDWLETTHTSVQLDHASF